MRFHNDFALFNIEIMDNKRYTLNISFKRENFEKGYNIVEKFKTINEAIKHKELIDETVDRAFIKDNVTGKITWLKE